MTRTWDNHVTAISTTIPKVPTLVSQENSAKIGSCPVAANKPTTTTAKIVWITDIFCLKTRWYLLM